MAKKIILAGVAITMFWLGLLVYEKNGSISELFQVGPTDVDASIRNLNQRGIESKNDFQSQKGDAMVVVPDSYSPVKIQAGSGESIEFQNQNGITQNGLEPVVTRIPRLVLYHNGQLTEND